MIRNYCEYHSKMTDSWIPQLVNSKDGVDFAMLFPLRESRRTSDSALLRVRSKELRLTLRRLDSEALRLLQRWGVLIFICVCAGNTRALPLVKSHKFAGQVKAILPVRSG